RGEKVNAPYLTSSATGTFETCPPILRMSVHRGRPEVAAVRQNRRDDPLPTWLMIENGTKPATCSECRSYLARFHTISGFDPAVSGFGTRYFSSSPESSILRFCAVPVQSGNIACSTCHVSMRSASLNDHFPQWVKFPTTVVL